MAITVLNQPEKVMLSKNPIILGLNTDNKYSTARVKASGRYRFLGAVAANNTLTINILGVAIVYTFKNDAIASGDFEIRRNDTAIYPNLSTWIGSEVIPALLKSYYIREYYDAELTYDGAHFRISLIAKKYGTEQQLLLASAGANLVSENTTAVEGVARPNYKLYCEVWTTRTIDVDTAFVKAAELESPADDDGNVYFNIERVLTIENNEIADDVEYSSNNAAVHLRYKLMYGEKYGDIITYYPATAIGGSYSNPLYALNGALAENVWPTVSFYDQTINAATPLFLNLHPRKLTVSREQPLWLYYFYNHTAGGWRLKYKAYDKTGGVSETVLNTSAINYTNRILAINVGASDIGVGANIYKYEIWLEKQDGTDISEHVTYLISEFDYEHNRYFYYRNSWGTYETIWCHGKAEQSNNFDYETAQVYVPGTSSIVKAASKVYGKNYETAIEVSTGIKGREDSFDGKAYRDYLADFFSSEECYEIKDGTFLPIELMVKNEPFGEDLETIFKQSFKYKYSFKNKGYTPAWL
jgi:hypothetical protein